MHVGKRNPACPPENSLVVEEAVNLPSFRAAALARPRGFATLFRNGEGCDLKQGSPCHARVNFEVLGPSLCRRLAPLHSQGLQRDNTKRAASLWQFLSLLAWNESWLAGATACTRATDENLNGGCFPRLALPRQVESSLNNTKANDSCWALVSLASASSSCSRAYSRIDQECARALGCGVLANLRHELQKLGSLQRVDGPRLSSSFTGHLQASSGKGSTGTSREHTECL